MVLFLLACRASDPYTLDLTLHLPQGVDDVLAGSQLSLVARDDAGATTVLPLGDGTSGDKTGIPALPEGTVSIGLLAEAAGGDPETVDLDRTLAWGEAAIEGPVGPGERVEAQLFVAPFREVSELDAVAPNKRALGGAIAVDSRSRVFLAGGELPGRIGSAGRELTAIHRMDLDVGDTSFGVTAAKLPQTEGEDQAGSLEYTGRVYLTATVVEVDGAERVLFAGGHPRVDYPFAPTDQALLYDPETDDVERLTMPTARSSHIAVRFPNGNVLLYGGFVNNQFPVPSFAVFDAGRGNFRDGTTGLDTGAAHVAAAVYDEDIVVCGGDLGTVVGENQEWQPQTGCNLIRGNGEVRSFDPLPEPLAGLAMASLPDGLLAAGGFASPSIDVVVGGFVEEFGTAPAVRSAYKWTEADHWQPVGQLEQARAHFAMAPLADGSVLVIGGDANGTGFLGDFADPVRCPERYDPVTKTFTLLDGCDDGTSAAYPMVGWSSGGDVVSMMGFTYGFTINEIDGGSGVSVSAVGPAAE